MALEDYKITDGDISAHGVVSAPDKLTGTAAENKAVFDALIREAVKAKLNDLIDELVTELTGKMPAPGDYGSDGQYLKTHGDGTVEWDSPSGSGDMLASKYDENGDQSGVVAKAAKLAVAHAIGGASFDGSGDVSLAEIGAAAAEHGHDAGDIDGGTLSADRLPTVPVNKGGTGATTAANARTNLGAAASSHNHNADNINSGTLDSGRLPTVPLSKGGTGATTAANARTNLGAAAASHTHGAADIASGTLSADRIPSLAASKIGSGTLDAARIPGLSGSKISETNTTLNEFSGRRIYISTGNPSGGSNGDVWIKYAN